MSLQIDPDRLSNFANADYMDKVEEQFGDFLLKHIDFGTTPVMSRTYGNAPEYDLVADFGTGGVLRIELKVTKNSWLPVEISDNGKSKGLLESKADLWAFICVGGTKFDGQGTVVSSGSKVEGKINLVKPSVLYSYIINNALNTNMVRLANFDGVEVVYINPRAFSDRIWMGGCEVALRTEDEMAYNSSEIKGFNLDNFTPAPSKFSIESVLQQTGKFDNKEHQELAHIEADRLVDMVSKQWEFPAIIETGQHDED